MKKKVKKPVRFKHDDKRRPKPDIALRYTRITRSSIGDLFTLEEFEASVLAGCFVNDDGHGYYGGDEVYTNQYAKPSDIKAGLVDRFWTHVMWFNK